MAAANVRFGALPLVAVFGATSAHKLEAKFKLRDGHQGTHY